MAIATKSDRKLDPNTRLIINHLLNLSLIEWSEIPSIADEFYSMEPLEQMEFLAEWNKADERLYILNTYHDGGEMDKEQIIKYHHIRNLIANHQNIINSIKEHSRMTFSTDISRANNS